MALCGIGPDEAKARYKKSLAADHDHKTGLARGYLCHSCNVGLGQFRDDPELLRSAIKYLAEYQRVQSRTDTESD